MGCPRCADVFTSTQDWASHMVVVNMCGPGLAWAGESCAGSTGCKQFALAYPLCAHVEEYNAHPITAAFRDARMQAITASLESCMHLVHGPPGTGKTTTTGVLVK